MSTLPTPAVDHIIDTDGLFFDPRELFLAALEDGFTVSAAAILVEEFQADVDAEIAAEQASEMEAENSWLRAAENAGWQEAEAERRWEYQQGIWS